MELFHTLNRYRLDVYILFTLMVFSNWWYIPVSKSASIDPRIVLWFCFLCGLIWLYLFNKLTDRIEDAISQPDEMLSGDEHIWLQRLLPLLVVVPCVILALFELPVLPFLAYILVGFLYSYPLYKHYRVKSFFGLKTIWAGIDMFMPVWLVLFFYAPLIIVTEFQIHVGALVSFFLIYLVGELIWDIRDVEGDRMSKVYTVPVVLGVVPTKVLCVAILTGAYFSMPSNPLNYLLLLVMFSFALLATPRSPRYIFHLMLYLLSGVILYGIWLEFWG